MNKICQVDGCNKKVKAHGYCNTHYEQIRKHGHLLEPKILNKNKICRVEGCNSPVLNKDYCSKHYLQYWKYGEIKEIKRNELYKNKEWLNKKYNIELLNEDEIAELCNVNPNTINRFLNTYQISLQYIEPELHSRLLYKTKKQYNINSMKKYLIDQYYNKNKSAIKIGNNLGGLDRRQIIEWMNLFNIDRRGSTEAIELRNSQNMVPTEQQWQIILGSWLGDGNIRISKNDTAQFRVTHGIDQLEYLHYKQKILEENNLLWFYKSKRIGGSSYSETSIRYSIESQYTKLLTDICNKCYKYGKANFNKEYLYQINDYGLYIWYLDDGSLLPNKTVVFCTDNFTYEDNIIIQQYFLDVYNLHTRIFTAPGKTEIHYRQRINPSESTKFFNIIDKFYEEVDCMKYKFNKNKI